MNAASALQLNLISVRVQSFSADMPLEFEPLIPGQYLQPRYAVSGQRFGMATAEDSEKNEEDRIIFLTTFNFWYHHTPVIDSLPLEEVEKHPVIATIKAEIGSVYTGFGLKSMDTGVLQKWGARNALLHQWPYWREFCHSSLMRMGLPPVVAPLWTPPTPAEISKQLVAQDQPGAEAVAGKKSKTRKKAS